MIHYQNNTFFTKIFAVVMPWYLTFVRTKVKTKLLLHFFLNSHDWVLFFFSEIIQRIISFPEVFILSKYHKFWLSYEWFSIFYFILTNFDLTFMIEDFYELKLVIAKRFKSKIKLEQMFSVNLEAFYSSSRCLKKANSLQG